MKMKVLKKVFLCIIIITMAVCFGFNIYSNADTKADIASFTNTNANGYDKIEATTMGMAGSVIVIARAATTSIAIVVLIVIAMKYMISAPGERADIKKHAVPYVIGAILLFGASGVLTIIGKVSKVITSEDAAE